MSLSSGALDRPVGTGLFALAVLLLGIAAFPLLPVAPLPQVDFPTLQVSAGLPGASPETMASSVAQPLERQFSQIPGLSQMTSVNSSGATQVTLQFDLDRGIDSAAQDVQSAVNAAGGQLPATLPAPPTIRKVNPADSPIMIIAALGTGLEEIRAIVVSTTVNQPKGAIDSPTQRFTLYTNDQIVKAAPWIARGNVQARASAGVAPRARRRCRRRSTPMKNAGVM